MKKYLVILFMIITCAVNAQVVNTSVWFAPPASADTLGPEMISNGTFTDGSDWTAAAGWTISGGVATYDDTQDGVTLSQVDADMLGSIKINTKYKLEFTLNISSGGGSFQITNSSCKAEYIARGFYTNGHYTLYFTTGDWISIKGIAFRAYTISSATFTLDDISLKEVY